MTKPVRILIVEDNPNDIDLARYEIHKTVGDCEFQVAETGEGFTQALETFQPDLILADYTLPHFNGMSALKLTLHHAPCTPLVIWTDSTREDVAVDCLRAGAANYILKDNRRRLGPAILRALEERKLRLARQQAEDALRTSEKRFRALIQNGMASIALLAADGTLIWESPAVVGTLQYAPNQHLGRNIFRELMHPDDLSWTQDMFARLAQEPGRREHGVFRLRHADGTWHWVEAIATNMLHEPEIGAIVTNYRDVHEQKQTEEALLSSERRFRALLENGRDDISLLAADGTLLWESPSTIRNLGYAPSEFVGRNILQLVHPEDLTRTQDSFAKLLQAPGDRLCGTFRLRRSDETWRWVEAVATNLLHEPGVNAIVINYRDITEQKQADIELQQKNNDLTLINSLNEVINRGESLDVFMDRLREEIKRIFSCEYTNIYLLSEDGRSLKTDQYSLPASVKGKIEKLIGRVIPAIEIPVRSEGLFQRVVRSDHGLVLRDPRVIQNWMGEFVETAGLPSVAKAVVRKLIPQLHRILNIKSIILVPLISDGKTLGVLNVSSSNILSEQELTRIENIGGHLTIALHRRQVEDALRESQAQYQNLVETSHDLIWSVDAQGRFTFVNRASQEIYGYEPEELLGRSFFEILDPDHYHIDLKIFQETLASADEIRELETYVRHRDGRSMILSANSIVVRDEHGTVTGVVGSSHDITVRKRVEDALKEERNLLRTLIDNIPDRIYAIDKHGRKTLSNTADWQASGGKTMEDVLGKTDFDTYPLELAEEFWKLDRAVLDSGQPVINYEEPGLDADGNLVSILTTKIPLRDDEGNVIGLVGIGRDITERKQAEERLRYSENRYRLVTQATNDIIWEWAPKTHQLFWSENARHVFGYSENEIGPDEKWWDDHVHPEDRERVLTKLNALIQGKQSIWLEEYRFLLKDGSYAYISDRAYIERDPGGTPLRMIGAMANITERKRAETERQALFEIMQGLANTKDLQELLQLVHHSIAKVICAENFFVALHQESTGLFEEIYSVDQYDPPAPPSKLENSITAYVFRSGQPLLLSQSSFEELAAEGKVKLVGTDSASWLGVPLKTAGQTIGVMAVQDYENDNRYSEREKDFLASIAMQVALVIERKRAEEALRESEEHYRAIFEGVQDAIFVESLDGKILTVNERACEMFGYSHAEFLTKTVSDLVPPGHLLLTGDGEHALSAEPRETTNRRANGELFPIEISGRVQVINGERILLVVVRDITERKRAEDRLRESEERFSSAFEYAAIGMALVGLDGRWLRVNWAFSTLVGYSEADLLHKTFQDITHPEDLETDLEYVRRLITGEIHSYQLEKRYIHKEGHVIWVLLSVSLVQDTMGKPLYFISQIQDITERKRAEEAVRQSENKARVLLNAIPDLMFHLDSAGTILDYKADPSELYAQSEPNLTGRNLQHISPPEFADLIRKYTHKTLESAIMQVFEYQLPIPGRGLRDYEARMVASGEQEVTAIVRDITERKKVETALLESNTQFRTLFEASPDAIVLIDPNQNWSIIDCNTAACQMNGYSRDELLGQCIDIINLTPGNPDERTAYMEKLRQHEILRYETSHRRKDGVLITVDVSTSLIKFDTRDLILGIDRDVTERKLAEEQLRRRAEETSALLETSLALTNLDLEATLQTIGNSANALFLADGCRIFLMEQDEQTLQCVLALGENTVAFSGLRLKLEEGVTGAVAASGVPEIVNHMQDDPRAVQIAGTEEKREAIMFAPLKERGQTIGVLSIRRIGEKRPFEPADLELLEAFASMAATAVSKARLLEETQHQLVELRDSEERFRQLANNIQEVFWMTDAENDNEVYMSPAVETIWGRPLQSLMYEPDAFMTSVFSDDRPAVRNAIQREKNGERVQIEYRIVRPDGSLRWIWDRAFPIVDDSGKVKRIAGISADITERREAELALAKSQNRYRELFDSSPISIWEEDFSLVKKKIDSLQKDGVMDLKQYLSSHPELVRELASLAKITDVNNASLELYGANRKEDLLRSLGDFFDGTSPHYFQEEIVELLGPQKRFSWEGTDVTLMGNQIAVLVNGSIPHGYEEDWSKVIVSIMDVTERRQAEQELRKLSSAVEHSGSAVVITDTTGRIEYVNRKFTQATGYSFHEILGQNPRILKSGFTTREEYEQLWQMITSGQEWHGELLNRRKDGTLFWESVTISPILNDRREITHFVSVKEDVTERKQNELKSRRHIAELEAVYENGLSVGRLLELGEIGDRVIETFSRYLPWHHVTIRLRKGESDDLELVSFHLPELREEKRADVEQHYAALINNIGQGLSGWVIQTGRALRTGNVHAHPQYVDVHDDIQSGLYMPLQVGDRVIGVISVESETPDAFTEQDERLLATLANQTAIAFENARLYEAVQKELLERKRAEEALRVSETHYHALADSITDILFEMDQSLHYTHWNKASEALTGIPADKAIGKSLGEIFGGSEEQSKIRTIYEDVLRTQQPRTFEMRLVLSGEKRSFEVNAYPSMRGVSVVAKDVTERKRDESIMQKRFELMEYATGHSLSELMQRTVDEVSELTGSTIGFFHFMGEDQNRLGVQTWSTNALRLFQVSHEYGAHLPLDQAGVWAEAVRQRRPLIQNDYSSLADKKGIPQGHVPIVREIIIPIIRNERIMAVMGIGNKPQEYTTHDLEIAARLADYAWDVTERKQMELALEIERNQLVQRVEERTSDLSRANSNLARALRVKDEFLANMSHELRTPLNAILGLSESLGEQIAGPLNEKQQKYISTISESGHHLLSLINDILDLAKIDAGQITLDINKVDIHSVCQASLRMIKQLAQKKNQEVSLEIDHGLGLMWADERRLKQMMVNLLGNAVKFTPENGKLGLEVHGDEEANQIAITVWDNGIGIKQEDLTRLFQPFVQLDSGLAREAPGTGLGLALVAQMARLHGGSVSAVSESGQGSRFTIVLPWEPALAIDTASRMRITGKFSAIKPYETNKPTILLVEDTKEVVMMLRDYLEFAGYKVFTAQDGLDGIGQARHIKPDLILMDVQMPHMDGFETTRKLRSDPSFRYTPIIALTALAMPHDRERCLEAGMDEYISKPVNLRALMKIIQSCLFEQESRTQ